MSKIPDTVGKRHPLHVRTTKQLRDKMEAVAEASGRSLAQEVEYRLERSFMLDEMRQAIREELAGAPAERLSLDAEWYAVN